MADQGVEHEICGNCKKEIPQYNYVMHTAHCARNITLCKVCKDAVPKSQYEKHAQTCVVKPKPIPKQKTPEPPKTNIEKSSYYQSRKVIEDRKEADRKQRYLERHEKFVDTGYVLKTNAVKSPKSLSSYDRKSSYEESSNGVAATSRESARQNSSSSISKSTYTTSNKSPLNSTGAIKKHDLSPNTAKTKPKGDSGLLACRYCDLELPKLEMEEHEDYCGSRTDKCLDCGELVMFKHKQVHMDTNHSLMKLKDEPGPKASWDSNTQRSSNNAPSSPPRRRRFEPTIYTDFSQFDPTDYLPSNYRIPKPKIEKGESYKEISRRLDCPAPQPPSRRRNPPTELCIPCEFCDTPIPHEELIQHETGCRPDLARITPRSRRRPSLDDDEYFDAPGPTASESEIELPCEFCSDMIPASQLLSHQATCG